MAHMLLARVPASRIYQEEQDEGETSDHIIGLGKFIGQLSRDVFFLIGQNPFPFNDQITYSKMSLAPVLIIIIIIITGKCKGFCALISSDIRNAFNTSRWNICIQAMVREQVPDYLLRMKYDYLCDRWVIHEGEKWSLKKEKTCGVPQGSRVGLLVWNVMYDDFLHMDLPAGTSIIGFTDDALVVCAADDVEILELRINESLW